MGRCGSDPCEAGDVGREPMEVAPSKTVVKGAAAEEAGANADADATGGSMAV